MTRQTLPIEFGTDTSSTALTAHSGLLLPLQFIQLAGLLDAVSQIVPFVVYASAAVGSHRSGGRPLLTASTGDLIDRHRHPGPRPAIHGSRARLPGPATRSRLA